MSRFTMHTLLLTLWACGTPEPVSPIAFAPTVARTPSAEPEDVVDGALAALARATDGARVTCPLPAELSDLRIPLGGADEIVRMDLTGPVARGVVRSNQGSARVTRAAHLCPAGQPTCIGEARARNGELSGLMGVLRWWDGANGVATCRFEPVDEVPFSGRVSLPDDRPPGDAGVYLTSAGCAWVAMQPDGTFHGARVRGEPCSLVVGPDTFDATPVVLDEHSPHRGLQIEAIPSGRPPNPGRYVSAEDWRDQDLPAADDERALKEIDRVLAARVGPSPITDALALPGLSDEVRAELARWREAEIAP